LADLNRKTEFRTRMKETNYEKKIDLFLGDWYGTTKGLSQEWTKKAAAKDLNYRPPCEKCDKYRCSHQIYHGRVPGRTGRHFQV